MSERTTASPVVVRRAGSALLLCPTIQVSYDTLEQWLAEHAVIRSVVVHGQEKLAAISSLLPTHRVQTTSAAKTNTWITTWRSFVSSVNHYEYILVLCAADEEVVTGHTVYRILGESLFSDYVVLLGPQTARVWPGGRFLISPGRARDLMTLFAVAGMGLCMTAISLVAVAVQEALVRVRLIQ
jgi:hypothetical protein